jgi:hypothetical protein
MTFIVRSRTPMTGLSVVDGGKKSPFVIKIIKMSDDNCVAMYKILFIRDVAEGPGERELLIRPDGGASPGMTLPVKIMAEEQS